MKKGYKVTNNFKCFDLTYEVGKEYIISDKCICHHGFHYSEYLEDSLAFINSKNDKNVFIEIEDLDDSTITDGKISVSSHIRVIREITREELAEEGIHVDEKGNLVYKTLVDHSYDEHGNIIKSIYESGYIEEMEYNELGKVVSYKDSNNFSWTAEYDDCGNRVSFKDCDGFSWTAEYDDRGNKISYKDSNGTKWEAKYDENGNRVSQTYAPIDSRNWEKIFDENGNCLFYLDINGWEKHKYDENGNEIFYRSSSGNYSVYSYDDEGRLIKRLDDDGFVARHTYDEEGRELTYETSSGYKWEKKYDEKGNQIYFAEYFSGEKKNEWKITIK